MFFTHFELGYLTKNIILVKFIGSHSGFYRSQVLCYSLNIAAVGTLQYVHFEGVL